MDFLFGDLDTLLRAVGLIGVFGIVFAETGLLIGFILPGDSFLVTAGFLASQGYFDILPLIAVTFLSAVLGDSFGYGFGRKAGPAIFTREDSLIFNKSHLLRAARFYEMYGGITVIGARFVPFIRTFAPILAGVGKMRYIKFLLFSITGCILWAIGLPLAGFFLGKLIPGVERYIAYIILLIVALSLAPPAISVLLRKDERNRLFEFIKKKFLR